MTTEALTPAQRAKAIAAFPSAPGLRVLADYLDRLYPMASLVHLVRVKDYDAAQQLVGAIDAIESIREVADSLDDDTFDFGVDSAG